MKSVFLSLTFSLVAIACFAQPRWYNTYTSMQSSDEIRSAVIALENAESMMITGGNVGVVDINGEWLWQKKIAGSGRIYDGVQLDDGTVVLVGYTGVNGDDGILNALLVHAFSPAGETLWSSGFSMLDKHVSGLCITIESDSTLLVGGYVANDAMGSNNMNGMLTRLSQQGELISCILLAENMAVQDIEPIDGGGGIGVGCQGQSSAGDLLTGKYSYFGFDSNLAPSWWYSLAGNNGSAIGVVPFGDNYAIAGTISENMVTLEISADGSLLDNGIYDADDDLLAYDIALSSDGNILVVMDQMHNTNGGGTVFRQPLVLRTSSFPDFDVAAMLFDGTENNRFTIGVDGMVDGSILVGVREGNNMGVYKLFLLEPLPGCALGQASLTVVENLLSPQLVSPVPGSYELNLSQESTPSFNSFSTDVNIICGGEYCELEIVVSSPDPNQCSGSEFEFLTNDETLVEYNWSFDGELIGAADTLAIVVEEWGFYEVQLDAYDANYCFASDVLSIAVLISPEPILTVADSVAICEGETLLISTTEEFDFYQWSTLSIQFIISTSQAGEFFVTVTGENGCQTTSDTTEVFVGEYPTPSVELTGENPFCADGSVTISTQEYAEYEWTFGQEVQSFETAMPGPYFVIATSDLGCIGISDTLWLDTLAVPTPLVLANGPLMWCSSDALSVGLGASGFYENVIWSNNVSDSSITVSNSGFYSYQATSFEGCSAYSDTITVISWINPIISAEDITETAGDDCDGALEISVLAETATYDIVWTDLPDETDLSISDLCYGSYIVTVTDENGCSSTETFFVDTSIGLQGVGSFELLTYPNPVVDMLNFQSTFDFRECRVIDNHGSLVGGLQIINNSIDCSGLSPGVYHVQLFDGSVWLQTRIIKL